LGNAYSTSDREPVAESVHAVALIVGMAPQNPTISAAKAPRWTPVAPARTPVLNGRSSTNANEESSASHRLGPYDPTASRRLPVLDYADRLGATPSHRLGDANENWVCLVKFVIRPIRKNWSEALSYTQGEAAAPQALPSIYSSPSPSRFPVLRRLCDSSPPSNIDVRRPKKLNLLTNFQMGSFGKFRTRSKFIGTSIRPKGYEQ
jgi:hypothetical protein